jgi:hypothetical protein
LRAKVRIRPEIVRYSIISIVLMHVCFFLLEQKKKVRNAMRFQGNVTCRTQHVVHWWRNVRTVAGMLDTGGEEPFPGIYKDYSK